MQIEKPVTYILLFITLLFFSGFFLSKVQFGSPSKNELSFSLTTDYYGVNAKEIERIITIPLEDSISDLPGIKKIASTSEFGRSRIMVSAQPGYDRTVLYTDLTERTDRIRVNFPKAVQKTQIVSSDTTNRPVFIVAFRSETMGLPELGTIIDKEVKPRFQRISGTGEIEIGGGAIQEVLINLDTQKAAQYGIDPLTVSNMLQKSYIRIPAGSIDSNTESVSIFFNGDIGTLDDFRTLSIRLDDASSVRLDKIAAVSRHFRKPNQISRINSEERIVLYIYSGGDANTLSLCNQLNTLTQTINTEGFDTEIVYNRGDEIQEGLRKIGISVLISMISLFVFIGIFLPDLKSRIVLSLSIPLTIIIGIAVLTALKIPIDSEMISGLAIGSGLIIDNYLVIFDYIRANRSTRVSPIAPPLIASTGTTVIVFLPLIMLRTIDVGINSIALAICGLLGISLFLCFTFLPKPLLPDSGKDSTKGRSLISLTMVSQPFLKMTPFSQRNRSLLAFLYLSIGISVPLFLFFYDKEFAPIDQDNVLYSHVEFPSGTTMESVDENIQPALKTFKNIYGVKRVESRAKRGNAQISITFDPRKTNITTVKGNIENISKNSTNGHFFVGLNQSVDTSKIQFTVTGYDHSFLREIAHQAGQKFSEQPWTKGVVYHFKENPPAYIFRPDPALSSGFNMQPEKAATILRWSIQGPVSLKWINDGNERDIRITGNNVTAITPFDLGKIPVLAQQSKIIRLNDLGVFQKTKEPDRLYRENRQNSVSFSVDMERMDLDTVRDLVTLQVQNLLFPAGYGIFSDDTIESSIKNYNRLYSVFLLAVFLIYIVLAIQTNSFLVPILILSVIPFSTMFPLALLALLGQPVTFASIIGLIILAGMAVNNYILILDAYMKTEATIPPDIRIQQAIGSRFNSLFMSCGTTIIAAFPILFTTQPFSDFPSSLACIIPSGVVGSFMGTFLFLPAISSLYFNLIQKYRSA
jgi:hydrophobic/amphiphilic exporter-1 (mainly G- bacteria), HAE1 family